MTSMSPIAGATTALVVGLLLQPVVVRVMTAAAVLDLPSERSSHTTATPRGGGIAVTAAATAGLLLDERARVLVVPLLLFAAIGLLEDLRGAGVGSRLALQVGAGTAGAVLLLPQASTVLPRAFTAVALAALTAWLVAYANAFNFMDGLNGMAAAHAALAGSVYAATGLRYDLPVLVTAGTVTAAAAVTFLPWNAGRARIFLGDVGSYGLGALIGAVAGYGLLHGVPVEAALAPLALYLADTGWTLLRRCYRREAWYRPHRTHAFQRLTDLGWSHQRVTVTTALVSAVVCAVGLSAAHTGPALRVVLDALALAILAAYLAAPAALRTWSIRRTDPDAGRRRYAAMFDSRQTRA
jgi:UDP-N-acetylmuramyl pentapeptide phosphotransferase/UDP-N-acetylglucosamine-1-phosphate transferase